MEYLKSKFLQGWFTSANMNNTYWFDKWFEATKLCEIEGTELVVFKIPRHKGLTNGELVAKIEKLIQQEYPE